MPPAWHLSVLAARLRSAAELLHRHGDPHAAAAVQERAAAIEAAAAVAWGRVVFRGAARGWM